MSKKRLFQILDEMNVEDAEKGTQLVAVCPDFISAEYKKIKGTEIKMGCAGNVVNDLMLDKKMAVLVLIDKKEYKKRSK